MTPPNDFERLAENLQINRGKFIIDEESFKVALQDYLGEEQEDNSILNPVNSGRVWRHYKRKYNVMAGSLHKSKGGRDLKLDRTKLAKHVVDKPEDYTDARRQDLRGYDTPKLKKIKIFNVYGIQKGRVTGARKIFITFYGKKQSRFIDRKGRYVSINKRQH